MDTCPGITLSLRFGSVVTALMQQIGGMFLRNSAVLPAGLMAQERLRSLSMRLRNLLERIGAGTLPAPRPGRPTRERLLRAEVAPGAIRLPRMFGWLVRNHGPEWWRVRDATGQVGMVLNEAATLEMLARAPRQAGRIVRPLCHALGLEVPEVLRLPPRAKRMGKPRARERPARKGPAKPRRVASAQWPKNVAGPGETVPLRSRKRRRSG